MNFILSSRAITESILTVGVEVHYVLKKQVLPPYINLSAHSLLTI